MSTTPTRTRRTWFVTKQYADGHTIANHVTTANLDQYIEDEATATLYPTTVTNIELCTDWLHCNHRQPARPTSTDAR